MRKPNTTIKPNVNGTLCYIYMWTINYAYIQGHLLQAQMMVCAYLPKQKELF